MSGAFLGLDFGTESVRAVAVDASGRTLGAAVAPYQHGQIVPGSRSAATLFPGGLPTSFALQHPMDWVEAAGRATREATRSLGNQAVAGIGVDFTSCTMLPVEEDGKPLCLSDERDPHRWPKLWKHHGALAQTERINALARARNEPWLARYGGAVGLEWLFPKMLEVIEASPAAAEAAGVWMEAGDWLVWQLVGAPWAGGRVTAADVARSTCQAGYKGLWSPREGFPSAEFLKLVHPGLACVRESKLAGTFMAPGTPAGELTGPMAMRMGLRPGIPVSAAIIDAHAAVPGAGVGEPGTLVMVMGTSGCHMLMSEQERLIPGVAGVVKDGILPGFYGYETGQAAMGDAFDLVRRLSGQADFSRLDGLAAEVPPGAGGVLALDWFNGCRTPLMDGALSGGFLGVTLNTRPEQLYRAVLEASAMGLRWIVDTLREGGAEVRKFVATGGLPTKNPLFARIAAAALGEPIHVHPAEHGSAVGAAILGALAAGAFGSAAEAVERMAGSRSALGPPKRIDPDPEWARVYGRLYPLYRRLACDMGAAGSVLRGIGG